MKFSKIIKELRTEYELTHKELADGLGCSTAIISHWENGKREPTAELIKRLANYFDVTTDFLLGLEEKNIPQEKNKITKNSFSREKNEITDYYNALNQDNQMAIKDLMQKLLLAQNATNKGQIKTNKK